MDTMVEIVFLLYLPPLAVTHEYEETTGTGFVTIGMVGISNHIAFSVHGSRNSYILCRFGIESTIVIFHEAVVLFSNFHDGPAVVDITVSIVSPRMIIFIGIGISKCTVAVSQACRCT